MGKYIDYIVIALLVILVVVASAILGPVNQPNINIQITNPQSGGAVNGVLGAIGETTPTNLDAGEYTTWNDGFFDDVEINDDLFVTGAASLTSLITDAFTQGGGITSTSTYASSPLLASYFDTENIIEIANWTTNPTITFPASSTLSSLCPTAGDSRSIILKNATTTGTITFAAGTGNTISNATSTLVVPAGDFVSATFVRQTDTDFDILFDIFQ